MLELFSSYLFSSSNPSISNKIPLVQEVRCCIDGLSGSLPLIDGFFILVNSPYSRSDFWKCTNKQRFELKIDPAVSARYGALKNSYSTYSWNFLLPPSFSASKRFSHIHQIHLRGAHIKMPLLTHTIRKCNEKDRKCLRFELRYSGDGINQVTLVSFNIFPYLGKWLSVNQAIEFSEHSGKIFVSVKHKDQDLFTFSKLNIRTWQLNNSRISSYQVINPIHYRPKWGIYRGISDKSYSTSILLSNLHLNNQVLNLPSQKLFSCSFDNSSQ